MSQLTVSEVFYSIQGEGSTMGTPSVFIRLAGCNLLCEGEGWRCDTIEVWQKGKRTHFADVLNTDMLMHLQRGAHLIFTGGEPLLHQHQITYYIEYLESMDIKPFIEVETNGTILPDAKLMEKVSLWNVSPKLSNSGESNKRRVKEAVIDFFNSIDWSIFKFVINDGLDVIEMAETYKIRDSKIYLMPAGDTQEKLNKTRPTVIELCKRYRYKYSERLHIVAWNKKTGV